MVAKNSSKKNHKKTLSITNIISLFFKNKAKEHGVHESNLFIENKMTHLSLCVFIEFESRVLEECISDL